MLKRPLLLFFLLPLLVHAQEKIDEQWYSLLLESRTVGYLHQTIWATADGLVRSEIEQTMKIRRFGEPFSLSQRDVWIEEAGSGLVSLSSEFDMNGQHQGVEVRAVDGGLQVRLRHGAGEEQFFLPVEGEPLGVYTADRKVRAMIGAWEGIDGDGAEKGQLRYHLFSPESLKVEKVQLRILGRGEVEDSLGRRHQGVLVEERFSGLPGVITTEVYGEEAQFLYSKTPVGLALEILRLDSDPQLPVPAVFDVASLTVAVRGLQALPLERTRAVTVLFRGQGVATLQEAVGFAEKDLVNGQEAQTRIVSFRKDAWGDTTELILYLENRPFQAEAIPSRSRSLPQEMESYLGGGFHLDLEDPRLAELLARCGTAAAIGTAEVVCLERLVNGYIENKSLAYGFAGLEEVLEGKAGDCTEHALLLVALLRKAALPSRLAYGLILTESGFIGHAWVELFTGGRWHWLDPSFPGGRPYGLKIRIGVMDPGEPVWACLSLSLLQVVGGVEAEILEAEHR